MSVALRASSLAALLVAACAAPRAEPADELVRASFPTPPRADAQRAPPASPSEPAGPVPQRDPEPLTLERLFELIAAANPTLEVANQRLAAARAAHDESRAAYLPTLSAGIDFLRTDQPSRAFGILLDQRALAFGPGFDPAPGAVTNWQKDVRLEWALFAPGRAEARHAAREGEEAARLAAEALERRLMNAGLQALLGLRASLALEEVARETIGVVERRLEETRRRHEAGAAVRADVLRLEVRLASARQDAAAAALGVARARSALSALIGDGVGGTFLLADEELAVGAELPADEAALLALAERERRDLLAAAHRVRMLAKSRDAARAARLPVLSFFGAYLINGPELAIDEELDSYALGVGLRLPLNAATEARIDGARAREREARAALRELSLAVVREVRDEQEAVGVAGTTLALAEASIEAAEEAYRMLAEAQDAGGATVTDVLEAQDARARARVSVVAARAGLELARARLVAATGGVR